MKYSTILFLKVPQHFSDTFHNIITSYTPMWFLEHECFRINRCLQLELGACPLPYSHKMNATLKR